MSLYILVEFINKPRWANEVVVITIAFSYVLLDGLVIGKPVVVGGEWPSSISKCLVSSLNCSY